MSTSPIERGFFISRLKEAVEPLQSAVRTRLHQRDWKGTAISLSNLSVLYQALGDMREALKAARRSVEIADQSGDGFEPIHRRARLADAFHQSGDPGEAFALFQEAEKMQAARKPERAILNSVEGSRYCDLLLAEGEPEEVLRRATQTLGWHKKAGWLLAIALDHLSLGRAHAPGSSDAARHLDEAVNGLGRAGQLDDLPRGLLARAAHFRHTHEWDKAQHDLDEVRVLATRCGMRLHLTDYHLEQARLLIDQQRKPEAKPHYDAAKKLVEETGYHRRDAELLQIASDLG
jgi:tetratricopeptide (TPR) repeat protein